LFCHSNRALPWEDTMNRFREPIFAGHGIGCERCHGPGEKHVRGPGVYSMPQEGDASVRSTLAVDPTIVHPGKLTWKLREAVCQQCHLEGEARVLPRGRGLFDFRPGLPLESCWSIFVRASEPGSDRKAVNHVEQMYLSRCFAGSHEDQKLGCISCHDPHQHIAGKRRDGFYRERCLQCHKSDQGAGGSVVACALPPAERRLVSKEDSCTLCHMPRYPASDIAHTASTDHRIPRRAVRAVLPPDQHLERERRLSLVHFHRGELPRSEKELTRDLGIALADFSVRHNDPAQSERALKLLETALPSGPDDWPAWERKAKFLFARQRLSEALAAVEVVLEKAPQRELSTAMAALFAQQLGDRDLSLKYWRRAVTINPWHPDYRGNLARLLAHGKDWDEARAVCKKWLELAPDNIDARQLWIECLLERGSRTEARREFDLIEALQPRNLEQLKVWFSEKMR
jgi:tetratricopeptide (TPR) repeat protein